MNPAITRAAAVMRDFGGAWGFAGGWAIDLFLGYESREHADVDIAVLRADQVELRSVLSAARLEVGVDHRLVPWPSDQTLVLPLHEIHADLPDGSHLEFLLNERDGDAPEQRTWLRDALLLTRPDHHWISALAD